MAVNVSAQPVRAPEASSSACAALLAGDAASTRRCIELEITESVIIEGARRGAARRCDELAALGVGIAIDDFGTGYSGLAYLSACPIDTLKIDQSFVRDLTIDPDDAAIVDRHRRDGAAASAWTWSPRASRPRSSSRS